MRNSLTVILILCVLLAAVSYLTVSCHKEPYTEGLTPVQQEIPASFPSPLYQFTDNPLTQEGFELGRRLFYDGRLSITGYHSCASCHEQPSAFGTYQHDRSHGVFESHTLRNAPVLFNLAWSSSFHWDGAFTSLEDEIVQPIHGSVEMGESFQSIVPKLEADESYRKAFRNLFGASFIRPEYILKALSQFTGSLTSANSKYDRYKKGQVCFTVTEEKGYQLFQTNCSGCHPEPLFTDYSFRNIGLPSDDYLKDYGRMRITGKNEDSLKFKVPTLRNCLVSSNYMHDGRFNTLHQCMEHYRNGIQQGPTLDPLLRNSISLSDAEVNELYAFLKTLTDSSFLTNPRYRSPG